MPMSILNSAQRHLVTAAVTAAERAVEGRSASMPVALHQVAFGQPFLLDANSNLMYVRVRDDAPCAGVVPIVVIGAADGDKRELGRIIGLPPQQMVRRLEILRPMQARAV